ncbi:phage tail tape measure protein [Providencia manganoxydans]
MEGQLEVDKKSAEIQERSIDNQIFFNQLVDKGTENATKRTREHEKLNKAIRDNIELAKNGKVKLWTAEQIKTARAGIDKAFKDPVQRKPASHRAAFAGMRRDEGAQSNVIALKAELEALSQESRHIGAISQQRRELWQEQAKFQILEEAKKERVLSLEDKSLLARKDSILAEKEKAASIGDQIERQKQLNQLRFNNDDLEAEIALRRETIGMTDQQIAQHRELLKLKSDWTKKGGSETDEEYLRGMDLIKERYKTEDWMRQQWEAGVKKAYAEYVISATDANAAAQQLTRQAFDSMTGAMTDFFTTGKAGFRDYATSFFRLSAKMITQLTTIRALEAGLGGTTVGNFLGLKGHATGGYTGDGGKYEPKGIVHGGEFVFTKEATQRLGVNNLYRLMEEGKSSHITNRHRIMDVNKGYASGGYVGGGQPVTVGVSTPHIARLSQNGTISQPNVEIAMAVTVEGHQGGKRSQANEGMSPAQAERAFKEKIKQVVAYEARDGGLLDVIIRQRVGR